MNKFSIIKFSGKTEWLETFVIKEGYPRAFTSILVVEMDEDNLNLLIVPQYGRNPNKTG